METPAASFPCCNCGRRVEPHWEFCITCGLRLDPKALQTVAHIDFLLAEAHHWPQRGLVPPATRDGISDHYRNYRRFLIDNLMREKAVSEQRSAVSPPPSAVVTPPSAPGTQYPAPGTSSPSPIPYSPSPTSPPSLTLTERLSQPQTLRWMVYGGAALFVVGALVYLRDAIALQLRQPIVQAGLLAAVTLLTFCAGVFFLKRTKEELAGRGLLLVGSLLVPLNPWFLVHSGLIARGDKAWVVGLFCTALYGLAAVALGERLMLYLSIPAGLLTLFSFLGSGVSISEGILAGATYSLFCGIGAVAARRKEGPFVLFERPATHCAWLFGVCFSIALLVFLLPPFLTDTFQVLPSYLKPIAAPAAMSVAALELATLFILLARSATIRREFLAADAILSVSNTVLAVLGVVCVGTTLAPATFTAAGVVVAVLFGVASGGAVASRWWPAVIRLDGSRTTDSVTIPTATAWVWTVLFSLKLLAAVFDAYPGHGARALLVLTGGLIAARIASVAYRTVAPKISQPAMDALAFAADLLALPVGLVCGLLLAAFDWTNWTHVAWIGGFLLWAGWSLFETGWKRHSTALSVAVLTLAVHVTWLAGLRDLTHWTAILAVLLAARVVAELAAANLGKAFGNTETSFGLDFGIPNHPAVIPARIVFDAATLWLLFVTVVEYLAGSNPRPLFATTFVIGTLYAAAGAYLVSAGALKRVYAVAATLLPYAAFSVFLKVVGHIAIEHQVPYLAAFGLIGFLLFDAPRKNDGPVRSTVFHTTFAAFKLFTLVAVLKLDGTRTDRFESLFIQLSAIGFGGYATVKRTGKFAADVVLEGSLAFIAVLLLSRVPVEYLPLGVLLYGLTCFIVGFQLLTNRERFSQELTEWASGTAYGVLGLGMVLILCQGFTYFPSNRSDQRYVLLALMMCAVSATVVNGLLRKTPWAGYHGWAGFAFGILFYVRCGLYFGYDVVRDVEVFSLPIGLAMIAAGALHTRRGSTAAGNFCLWQGSVLVCVPPLLHAFQVRFFLDGSTIGRDILVDTVCLGMIGAGMVWKLRAPVAVGLTTLAFHLMIVVVANIPWGEIHYAVYLAAVGITLFAAGWILSRRRRQFEEFQTNVRRNFAQAADTFSQWR